MARRIGTLIVFKKEVTDEAALEALRSIASVIDTGQHSLIDSQFSPEDLQTFDDECEAPAWCIP